jgi:hypothetical protein
MSIERVARRIGMRRGADVWYEQPDKFGCMEDDLRAYLLTQALRVLEVFQMSCVPTENWPGDDDSLWYAEVYSERHVAKFRSYGPNPDAAIIALAERIEGEGRE